jgi:hypothetical protein
MKNGLVSPFAFVGERVVVLLHIGISFHAHMLFFSGALFQKAMPSFAITAIALLIL